MKSVGSLYSYLDKEIPGELSLSWDNDGLMVCSAPERECKRVLLTLDVTRDAVDYGVKEGFDVIISHHPLIFKALCCVNTYNFVSEKVIKLIKSRLLKFIGGNVKKYKSAIATSDIIHLIIPLKKLFFNVNTPKYC